MIFKNDVTNIPEFLEKVNITHTFLSTYYSLNYNENFEYTCSSYKGYTVADNILITRKKNELGTLQSCRDDCIFSRPINEMVISHFPFPICGKKWIYLRLEADSLVSYSMVVESGLTISDEFYFSIMHKKYLLFNFKYATLVSLNEKKGVHCFEYLLCFDAYANYEQITADLTAEFATFQEKYHVMKSPCFKELKTEDSIAGFFRGDYLFERFSGISYFSNPHAYFSIYEYHTSLLEYYILFSYISPVLISSGVVLNNYLLLYNTKLGHSPFVFNEFCNRNIQAMFDELSLLGNPLYYAYLTNVWSTLSEYYVYITPLLREGYNTYKKELLTFDTFRQEFWPYLVEINKQDSQKNENIKIDKSISIHGN